jgi:pimeloyl-ACP methyl ester carboxylesterase
MRFFSPACTPAIMRRLPLVLVGLLLAVLAIPATASSGNRTGDCPVGIYQLDDGSKLDIGLSRGNHLRWSKEDGTTGLLTKGGNGAWTSTLGWTGRPDGKRVSFDCNNGTIDFAGVPGKQIPLKARNVMFQGAGVQLAGQLVMPQGTGRVPIVILVHGSEHDSALKFYSLQRQLPADGIGVFVYDKRGTGKSGGVYTQNYLLLADDAIAAMNEAKRLAGARAGRIGYQGGSQAGWVAPLAARIAPVDFMIVGYGLAVSPLDEVREATAFDLTSRGYGPDVVAKAMHIADAVSTIIVSNFRKGYDQLAAVKAKYGKEPWFKYVRGDVVFYFLETPEAKIREQGPQLLAGVPANYDPMPVLRNLDIPQLWILAADDHDAPSAETERRLRALQAKGKPITVAVFPHTEHGIYEYETKADGTRTNTRNPKGYFAMMRDFILHGRLTTKRYGNSTIYRPATATATASARH